MVEGRMWLDEEGGVWLDAEHACDVKVCILPPTSHEQENAPASTPSAVYAPSSLLCTIPYFQASLSEPWQKESITTSSSQHEITLECADSISPSDYQNCLLFLVPQKPVHMSVENALRLLHAADHLLYQDCADVCMAYLASRPWSDKEEEIIQQSISSLGVKPSSDLAAKLASADDMRVYKEVLVCLAERIGFGENHVAAIRDFIRATFNEAPDGAACVCMSVISNSWTAATNDLIIGCLSSLVSWNALTLLLLEYGDAEKLLKDFVGVSKKLCGAIFYARDFSSLKDILRMLFVRVVTGTSNNNIVLLSNSDRATLLGAWAPMVAKLNCRPLETAFRQLFTTLPLQDPTLVALVKEEASSPYFEACYIWWRSKLFKRMKRRDLVREEIDLEASSSTKRVKLANAD